MYPDDTLVEIGGVKVGIVGIADPATPRTTMPRHVADLRFAPPAPVVREHSRALRARGATKVILVAHLGGFCDREDVDRCNGGIFTLAQELGPGVVDAIVSGHTHSQVGTVVNGIPIVQARLSGRAVGIVDLPLDGRDSSPVRPMVRVVESDSLVPEADIAAIVRPAMESVQDRVSALVVENATLLPRDGDQYPLGNIIADAQRAAGRGDVSVMNNGGIRTELRAGPVLWWDLFELQPFANRLVAVRMRGSDLRRYLEGLVGGNSVRFHVSGLVADYDPKAAAGSRLRRVILADGAPLDDRRTYRVVMTDFLAAEGDGARIPAGLPVEEVEILDLDALVAYLKGQPGGRLVVPDLQRAPRLRRLP